MKNWLYLFIISLLLLAVGVLAYFFLQSNKVSLPGNNPSYDQESDSIQSSTQSQTQTETASPNTIMKAEIKDGKIINPPPTQENPILITLSEINAASGKLRGKINIDSQADFGYRDVLFIAQLKGKNEWIKSLMDGKEIDVMVDAWPVAEIASDKFSIEPKEQKTLDFEMDYPKGALGEDYTISVRIVSKDEFPLATSSQQIKIQPEGGFLTISQRSCKITANDTTYEQWMGPNINPGERVTGSCEVTNPGTDSVSATPYIRAAERFVIGYNDSGPLVFNNQELTTWAPGETKTITFELPPQDKPQTYQAIMQLVDQNNLSLSTFAPFRYVVRGASAVVRSAQIKSISILKDDEFDVEVFAAPSMDLFWRVNAPENTPESLKKAYSLNEGTLLKKPKLVVSVNSGSTLCAQNTLDMPPDANSWVPVTMKLKALEDCNDPVIEAKVLEADSELADYQKDYISPSEAVVSREEAMSRSTVLPIILAVIFVLLIIALIVALLWFKKKPPVPPVAGLILIGLSAWAVYSLSTFVVHKVFAGYEVAINPPGRVSLNRAWDHYTDFIALNGSNNYLTYSNGAVFGQIQQNVGCPACINCTMGYLVEIWIDGGQASIDGQPGGYYMSGFTTNSSMSQNMQTPAFRATRPGVDLTTGTHTVEARTIAVEITNYQISARSTGGLNEGDDHNCGMTDGRGCYGLLSYSWGVTPVGSLSLSNNYCQGVNRLLEFSFSANTPVQQYHLDKNGSYVGSSPGSPITVGIGTGENANYSVRVQTASGTYGGSNVVNVTGAACIVPNLQQSPQSSCGNIRLNWTPYVGASSYKVLFMDQTNQVSVDNNIQTTATSEDMTTADGLTLGNNYSFLIAALDGSGGVLTYSDNGTWSHTKFGSFTNLQDCRPPSNFLQAKPIDSCQGINPRIDLSWGASTGPAPMNYKIHYFDSAGGGAQIYPTTGNLGNVLSTTADSSWGLIPGRTYSFLAEAMNNFGSAYSDNGTWSHLRWGGYTLFPNCIPPTVDIQINNQPNTGTPQTIYTDNPAVLTWQATNASSCTASSNPTQSEWNGPITLAGNPANGTSALNTSTAGLHTFTLSCVNGYTGATETENIQLIINRNPSAFIQTTGGDVHTNEVIRITPP